MGKVRGVFTTGPTKTDCGVGIYGKKFLEKKHLVSRSHVLSDWFHKTEICKFSSGIRRNTAMEITYFSILSRSGGEAEKEIKSCPTSERVGGEGRKEGSTTAVTRLLPSQQTKGISQSKCSQRGRTHGFFKNKSCPSQDTFILV